MCNCWVAQLRKWHRAICAAATHNGFTHHCRTTFSVQPRGRGHPEELQQGRSVSHHPNPPPSLRSSGTFPAFDSAPRTARVILRLGMFPYQQLQADDFCRWTDYSSQGCNLVRIPHRGNTQCKGEGKKAVPHSEDKAITCGHSADTHAAAQPVAQKQHPQR